MSVIVRGKSCYVVWLIVHGLRDRAVSVYKYQSIVNSNKGREIT